MQLRAPSLLAALALLLATLASLLAPARARADGSSGTWSGDVELRGNYYWERSTRVIAPEVRAELEAPDGTRIGAGYLVDTITSASQAAGARTDRRFTEVRHDVTLLAGHELDLGWGHLDLSANGRYSHEPDYTSAGGGLTSRLSLNDRSTVLRLGATYIHDVVGMVLRGANRVGDDGRDLSDRGTQGTMNAFVLNLGLEQVLSPRLTFAAGYDLVLARGYQHNAYRTVGIDGSAALPENHPDRRTRHNAHARLAWYIPETGTALHAMYRAYMDSWDIAALTPEARVYQELGDLMMLRARYRLYTQTPAFFVPPPGGYDGDEQYVTDDPKMTRFHTHLLGAMWLVHLEFLDDSPLDFAWRATLELTFEYIWNTNSYGDGVIAQVAARVPF